MRIAVSTLVFLSVLFSANFAFADTYWPSTAVEFARLPPYCKARAGKGNLKPSEVEIQHWKQKLGPGFLHVHHLCAALNFNNKYPGTTDESALRVVIKELDYLQEHAPSDFPLHPLVSVERGKFLLRLNLAAEAILEFQNAIRLKPSYTPPYAELADYYAETGQTEEAINILREGLKHSPKSRRLKRRLAKLTPSEE